MKKLLVITQKVNKNDSNLGFFHEWLLRLAGKVEKLTVICLEKGEYTLPDNVTVLSLGKERKNFQLIKRISYLLNFYYYIWKFRKNYDGVFVHMNPEYCIFGGIFWRLWHKKILLWYTHKAVNWRLRLGVIFATKIFTASRESFCLNSKKVEVVGHGIPVELFAKQDFFPSPIGVVYLLSIGRITASKDLETVIRGVMELNRKDSIFPRFAIDFVGDPITEDDYKYKEKIRDLDRRLDIDGLSFVTFKGMMPNEEINKEYQSHHILIHTSRTGSMDKVVLEALAAGRVVITSSEAFADLAKDGLVYSFPAGDYKALANTIEKLYISGILNKLPIQQGIDYVRQNHNIDNAVFKIVDYFLCQNYQ